MRKTLPVSDRPVVYWRRVIAHAAIAFVVLAALGGMGAATFASLSPYEAGRVGGTVAAVGAVAAGIASYLTQLGAALVVRLAAVVAVVGVAVLARVVPHRAATESALDFAAVDRAPLVEEASRLRHPTLGFSIARPPAGFVDAPRLAAAFARTGGFAYAYTDPASREGLFVLVGRGRDGSRADLTAQLLSMRNGIGDRAHEVGSAVHVEIAEQNVTGDDQHLEGHFHAIISGRHMRAIVHPLRHDGAWVFVTILVTSADANALSDVLGSFEPG
jgi:hypothetical protein